MRLVLCVMVLCFPLAVCVAAQNTTTQEAPANQQPSSAPEKADLTHVGQLMDQGKYDEAITELKAFSQDQPSVARALGLAYYKRADYVRASIYLEKATVSDAQDKEATQLLGLSYYFIGKPKQAIPLLERVQSWYPKANVDAAYILGVAYIQSMDYERARHSFAVMYGVPPESAVSHVFLARMLLRQGYDPVAEAEARKAIELDPKLPLAHNLLGELYIFKSRIPEAIKELEAELAINPAYAPAYYRLADAYTRVMRWEDAERLLQRSIWLDATASGPYILLGKVLLKKNEATLAVGFLQRAISMDANNYMAHYLLGQAYRTIGKSADAERELEISAKLQAAQSRSDAELH